MGIDEFRQNTTIFRNEDVLTDDYIPNQLPGREKEIEQYQSALQPVVNGSKPNNIFLYGQSGIGKTLVTRKIVDQLDEDQQRFGGVNIDIISLLCKSYNTSYQVAGHLLNELLPRNRQITISGYSFGEILEKLWTQLNNTDATHVLIVLDEIDSIGSDDDILYHLPRCSSNGKVEGTQVGVIGICNDLQFYEGLAARVQSSLCDREIHFQPYDANQLNDILSQRAEEAFADGACDGDVVPLVSALTAQNTGSARDALDMLSYAGEIAQMNNADQVSTEHVREAERRLEANKLQNEVKGLTTQGKLSLYSVVTLEEDGIDSIRSEDIYERYREVADAIDVDVKTPRTVREHLSTLSMEGLLTVKQANKGIKGGIYNIYELGESKDVIRDALAEDNQSDESFDRGEAFDSR